MKKCPKCGKIYDDSWGVCLGCGETLCNSPENGTFEKHCEGKREGRAIGDKNNNAMFLKFFLLGLMATSIVFSAGALLGWGVVGLFINNASIGMEVGINIGLVVLVVFMIYNVVRCIMNNRLSFLFGCMTGLLITFFVRNFFVLIALFFGGILEKIGASPRIVTPLSFIFISLPLIWIVIFCENMLNKREH